MGMSQDAYLGWGFDVGGHEEGWKCNGEKWTDLIDDDFLGLLEFTEAPPWNSPGYDARSEEGNAARLAWHARRDAAIPLNYAYYGHVDYSGDLLVLERHAHAYWGYTELDKAALAPPTDYELECFNKVLDHIEFEGDRKPRLLLWASYG